MITLLILIPLVGAIAVSALPRNASRPLALLFALAGGIATLTLWKHFDPAQPGLQMIEWHPWIPAVGASYVVGVDGISILFLFLTSLIVPFGLLAGNGERNSCALMLLLQSALYGTFAAQNFVLWFLFYEMSLVPAFFLIRMGPGENSARAATKFFVYTFLGSVAMLLGFLAIYSRTGTFDFVKLAQLAPSGLLTGPLAWFVFICIAFGLAVKVPLFPFHTWLPDAYASAPTGVVMVLTGVLSKMGVYGFARLVLPLFPHQLMVAGPWLLALAVCSIVFAALAAWAQSDLKRMIAYLSISHLGYCMLGFFAVAAATNRPAVDVNAALSGVFMQVFNHGLTAAALFYFAGLLEKRSGLRSLDDFCGLMQRAPIFCAFMSVAMFSSLGLPILNGFIGEFLIFKGSFTLASIASSFAALGLLFTAAAFLRAMQSLFSGPLNARVAAFPELTPAELAIVAPATLLMLWIGISPQFLLNVFNSAVVHMSRLFA